MLCRQRGGYGGVGLAVAVGVLVTVGVERAAAQATLDWPVGAYMPYRVDSGVRANPAGQATRVFRETIHVEGAAWLRLYFSDVVLGAGSVIRMTSLLDGEVQALDADGVAMWSQTSAYFNGDTVVLDLVAGPNTTGDRVVLEEVAWEATVGDLAGGSGECGICGSDNRVPSSEEWTGRLLPAGCTASVWNTESCLVSAGHCMGAGTGLASGFGQLG
ncbi:MAG: hypothetical protein ACE5E6_02685, partial [Phycisphaerae bacterium]